MQPRPIVTTKPKPRSIKSTSQTIRSCDKCTQCKPNNQNCKRTTCTHGPQCWQHTIKLVVKPSTIAGAGKGLYTNSSTTIPADTNIVRYTGDKLNLQQLNERYPGNQLAQYVFKVKDDYYIDAVKSNAGLGRYANSRPGNQNAKFVINFRDRNNPSCQY